ncbi:MAG TPA: hypothetical protein VHF01_04880 [Candidatus Acidoferrum sp.]|nr:hypothetical protein [Candidatus Acidoferrum sp.]
MPDTPQFDPNFEDTSLQAQFRILLALSRALTHALSQPATFLAFERAKLSGNQVVAHLGSIVAAHTEEGIEEGSAIDGIWEAAFASPKFRNTTGASREILEAIRAQSLTELPKPDAFSDLVSANATAHRFTKDTLKKHGLAGLLVAEPALVQIFADLKAVHFCAGTSRIANKIRWAYQPVAHALEGIVLADLVLAHEYLSHLVPKNSRLDQSVREGWLVSALRESFQSVPAIPHWKRALWAQHRADLYRHFLKVREALPGPSSAIGFEGFSGLDEQAIRLHARSTAQFWKFTGAILEYPESLGGAEDIAWLLGEVVRRGTEGIDHLMSLKYMNLEDLVGKWDP